MILLLNQKEIACLILHMNTMRTNIKNVLKKNYGRKEAKGHLKCFDQVKEILKENLQQSEDPEDKYKICFAFDEDQGIMLSSFIDIYIEKLASFLEEAKTNHKEDKEQMDLLKEIKRKIDQEKEAA